LPTLDEHDGDTAASGSIHVQDATFSWSDSTTGSTEGPVDVSKPISEIANKQANEASKESSNTTPNAVGYENEEKSSKESAGASIISLPPQASGASASPSLADFTSPRERFLLSDLNFSTNSPEELIAIIGAVGSGKSSFMSAILGEMRAVKGTIQKSGRIAFCAQTPWIQNLSLKDNILFGANEEDDTVKASYEASLEAAALRPDLAILPHGDMTEIGERGINLSGGQKARVSIARAIFAARRADIVLMDDPWSAVDGATGNYIFKHGIQEQLSSKLRIIALNSHMHLVSQFDRVIVLRDGVIDADGTPAELYASRPDLMKKITGIDAQRTPSLMSPSSLRSPVSGSPSPRAQPFSPPKQDIGSPKRTEMHPDHHIFTDRSSEVGSLHSDQDVNIEERNEAVHNLTEPVIVIDESESKAMELTVSHEVAHETNHKFDDKVVGIPADDLANEEMPASFTSTGKTPANEEISGADIPTPPLKAPAVSMKASQKLIKTDKSFKFSQKRGGFGTTISNMSTRFLIERESRSQGMVTLQTFCKYFASAVVPLRRHKYDSDGKEILYWPERIIGAMICIIVLIVYACSQGCRLIETYFLGEWAEEGGKKDALNAKLYYITFAAFIVLIALRGLVLNYICMLSSFNVHRSVFHAVLAAPIPTFFDTHTVGEVLNRFSKDTETVDSMVPEFLLQCLMNWMQVIGVFVLCALATPWFCILMVSVCCDEEFTILICINQYWYMYRH
jgi:ABC-type multidrug transport system fused ATPase/permease subunit